MKFETKFETTGPFFDARRAQILNQTMNASIKELIETGQEVLMRQLSARPQGVFLSVQEAAPGKATTGFYRRNISTRFSNLSGLISDGGVVYGPWLEGISSRNDTTRFKGYATFRRVGEGLRIKSRKVIEKHLRRFVSRMNG